MKTQSSNEIKTLVTEFQTLTNNGYEQTYRKGEIISQLSAVAETTPREIAEEVLGIAKSQAYDLVNIYEFAKEIPTVNPVEVIKTVGTHNIRWLSSKSRLEQREEVQQMVNCQSTKDEVQLAINLMKDATKAPKGKSKLDEANEHIAWLEKALHDTMIANEAAQKMVGELLEEVQLLEAGVTPIVVENTHEEPVSIEEFSNAVETEEKMITKTAQELKAMLRNAGLAPVKEEVIPTDIIEEALEEFESEEEVMEFHQVSIETPVVEEDNMDITTEEYEHAKQLVRLGIGSKEDREIVREYEEVNEIGGLKERLARLQAVKPSQSATTTMYVATSDEDEVNEEWDV